MTVSLPSATTNITVTGGTGDVLQLASQIANLLFTVRSAGDLAVTNVTSTGSLPSAPNVSAPTITELALSIPGSGGITATVPSGWQYVVDVDDPDTLTVNNAALVTSTIGGSWFLEGTSTIAATGGNNSVAGIGNYVISFGPGNNIAYADGAGTVATDTGASTVISAGTNNYVQSNGTGDFVIAQGTNTSITGNGPSIGVLGAGGAIEANLLGDYATVSTANSNASITAAGSYANIFAGSGTVQIDATGGNESIAGGSGTALVSLAGSNSFVFTGSGTTDVTVTGTNDSIIGGPGLGPLYVDAVAPVVVFGGAGPETIQGSASTPTVLGGTGTQLINVGTGGLLFASEGTTNTTILGGGTAGKTTVFGGNGGDVTFNSATSGTVGSLEYVATAGSQTVNATLSNSSNLLSGGTIPSATASMVGGAGNDTLFAGAGSDTLTGGGGDNTFALFASNASLGAHQYITDFTAGDTLIATGFGGGNWLNIINSASVPNSSGLTVSLTDGTKVTFTNLTSITDVANAVNNGKFIYN